jgi:DNA polymerase (family 10)
MARCRSGDKALAGFRRLGEGRLNSPAGQNERMPQANDQAAALLNEYAELHLMTGGDQFRARSYDKAARAIAGLPQDVSQLTPAQLQEIPGVGKAIAGKISEITATGTFAALERLRAEIPDGVLQLTRIPALGPKRALMLYRELRVGSPDELRDAIKAGRLEGLRGFGAKSEEKLLQGIELLESTSGRVLLNVADETASRVVQAISAVPGCLRCAPAGSLRRFAETVGDVDVLAAADDSGPLMAALTGLPEAAAVIAAGPAKTSVRTAAGLQVDLRVVPLDSWGAALQYFTGSQAHNVAVREIAVRKKLKLSEYGLFDAVTGEKIVSETEEEVYRRLGMAWIPPTLREHTGEIEVALHGGLPDLVAERDIRGDLHTHTDLTDGVATLEEMVARAQARGYAYYAITDHAPDLVMQRMTDEKMLAQREQVHRLGASLAAAADGEAMVLLHGTELNIAPGGTVDWPAEFLDGFDVCVASVHSHFDQSRAAMTRRFVTACENPHVNVIGHPLARRIGRRPPVDVDLPELFRACARTGTALEVNAHPNRLDLPSAHIRAAKDAGVRFAIDSDAHFTGGLDYLRYGVGTGQRGWLTPEDVINTWPLPRLREFLRKGRQPGRA